MGYAGYVPAKLPPTSLTPVQAALAGVTSVPSLEIMEKLTYNVAVNPSDPKFKKIRLGNARIKAALVESLGAMDAMFAMGWTQAEDDGEAVLTLSKAPSMAQVRDIQDAVVKAKKAQAEAAKALQRSASAGRLAGTNAAAGSRENLLALLEADRKERSSQGPVVQGSKAQQLPSATAQIRTAGEAGLNRG